MSFAAHVWASSVAPIANVYEYAVLNRMADEVDESGEGCILGTPTIARDIMSDTRTVRRTLDSLLERKLIGLGDQSRALYIRADRRPTVYDILIPAECFADLKRTNERRAARGMEPITPENRPVQGPPPDDAKRAKRKDAGAKRFKKIGDDQAEQDALDGAALSAPSSLNFEPQADGGTSSPRRGD